MHLDGANRVSEFLGRGRSKRTPIYIYYTTLRTDFMQPGEGSMKNGMWGTVWYTVWSEMDQAPNLPKWGGWGQTIRTVDGMTSTQTIRTTRDAIALAYASYNHAKPYIGSGPDREVRHPEWTGRLLAHIGHPDWAGYNVAVTGSKGKGSHAILLAAILERLGYRVGLFTGPHLIDFMERFRVNGVVMPEPEFIQWMQLVYEQAEKLPLPQHHYLGPVGLLAVVASLWFRERATDVNIFECGRGALHDDVNQVRHAGALLTPVFLEHQRELGPTLADVAREKAGVLTPDTRWLVGHRQSPAVSAVLADAVRGTEVEVAWLDHHFQAQVRTLPNAGATCLDVVLQDGRSYRVWLPSFPEFLARNAAVALLAALRIWRERPPVAGKATATVQRSHDGFPEEIDLRDVRLPGRMDVIVDQPLTLVDGTIHAQTATHVARWAESARRSGRVRRFGMVMGIPSDKDGKGVLGALKSIVDWVILTRASNPHLQFDDRWLEAAVDMGIDVVSIPDVDSAVAAARSRITDRDGLLLLGTQSFVADVMRIYGADTRCIWRRAASAVDEGKRE
jgi:dihydrofolate synthase/folylpolyglutamate synthase